jgi:hypothetical protein
VFDPATGQVIATVAEADKADVDDAVKAARRAFETGPWYKTSPQDRSKLIWKLADLLESYADEIAQLKALDNGKPIRDAQRRPAGLLRDPALHGRLSNQDQRLEHHDVCAWRLAYPARAAWRRRADHPVEFSIDDGGVENCAGTGRRLHDRPKAG